MAEAPVNPSEDIDITLSAGDMRLTVSPYGASLRGLSFADGRQVITEYRGAANKIGGQGDVLIPFPGRVNNAKYSFGGRDYTLLQNDKETPSAIHGFLRTISWWNVAETSSEATFQTEIDAAEYAERGYPFSLDVRVTYRALETGMECEFQILNSGCGTAPVAAGFHPYFTLGSEHIDADTLHVPFNSYLDFVNLIPTGKVLDVDGAPVDFRNPQKIESTSLNTCYLNPVRDADGKLRVTLSNEQNGRSLAVWMDQAFDYVVLYSGDPLPDQWRRRSLAIEPMTCGSDAFNHHDWGLVSLQPGQTLRGTWGVEVK